MVWQIKSPPDMIVPDVRPAFSIGSQTGEPPHGDDNTGVPETCPMLAVPRTHLSSRTRLESRFFVAERVL
jgi:hypothetical protein